MADIKYTLTFFSDWHCGSGLSAGPDSDNLVKKNKYGLPYVPGKTIKGLLQEAANDLFEGNSIHDNFIKACFGEQTKKEKEETENAFFYSNAELSQPIANFLIDKPEQREKLYRKIPSTSIDEKTGVAEKHSLRTIEATIPVILSGEILNIPDCYQIMMEQSLKIVKRLGENRSRGLGRCQFSINGEGVAQ